MAASKNVKRKANPGEKRIRQNVWAEGFYQEKPAWNFKSCDQEEWAFNSENVGDSFWNEILPTLRWLETRTWNDILLIAKKQNHTVDVSSLNPCAQKRMDALMLEAEALISLRLTGKHRIYGYMVGNVFNILWYDTDHGDNPTCVCRSRLKHT